MTIEKMKLLFAAIILTMMFGFGSVSYAQETPDPEAAASDDGVDEDDDVDTDDEGYMEGRTEEEIAAHEEKRALREEFVESRKLLGGEISANQIAAKDAAKAVRDAAQEELKGIRELAREEGTAEARAAARESAKEVRDLARESAREIRENARDAATSAREAALAAAGN